MSEAEILAADDVHENATAYFRRWRSSGSGIARIANSSFMR